MQKRKVKGSVVLLGSLSSFFGLPLVSEGRFTPGYSVPEVAIFFQGPMCESAHKDDLVGLH